MMDVVYLIKVDPENNSEELRYSLRSLSNLPHGRVYIVGEKPDWVTQVTHIPVPQIQTKAENVAKNMRAAIEHSDISQDFILMNDDFFIMNSLSRLPDLNFGTMENVIALYNKRYPQGSEYIDSMKRLFQLLVERGCQCPISYELHTPMVFDKQKLLQMYAQAHGRMFQIRTYYGNLYGDTEGNTVPDVKIFLEPIHNNPEYNENPEEYLSRQDLLSATGGAFKKGFVGRYIRAKFPDKSEYEL